MRHHTVSPVFGEEAWLFSATAPAHASLEVAFSSPIRIRRVRLGGRLAALDDRDADIVEMATRLGVQVMLGAQNRYYAPDVREGAEVKIWISKTAPQDTTARFRWSVVGE